MDRFLDYFHHHPWLVLAALVVLILVIALEMRARVADLAAISPQDAIRLMNRGAVVIDLRSPELFAAGHLTGARLMNGDQILKAADVLKKYKEKPLIVYDESGSLGTTAARQLKTQGFTHAFNLRGGAAAWRTDNLPLEKGSKAGA